jgi:hypothetical protein
MTATQVVRRAWEIRPGALETPIGVIAVCLGDLLLGIPAALSALVIAGVVLFVAVLTAVSELREEERTRAGQDTEVP